MKIEFKNTPLKKTTPWGEFETKSPWDAVLVDGKQVGWRPSDEKDPNHTVLHPLSGVPQALAEAVAKSKEFAATLKAPKPSAGNE